MTSIKLTLLMLVLFGYGQALASTDNKDLEFSSGAERVALLELYTSEGCNSCPPADRWLGALKSNSRLWNDFIPIAFHVDYWDYIGWQDRFAKPEYGDRQRRYAEQGGARFVYTPGFFYDGAEWTGWRANEMIAASDDSIGILTARVSGDAVAVHFNSSREFDDSISAHIALLGMNLSTRVRAGENKGKTLAHDFVALGVTSVTLEKSAAGYSAVATLPDTNADNGKHAIAVWVANSHTQAPIQATGGLLPDIQRRNSAAP